MGSTFYFISDVHLGMKHYNYGKLQEDVLLKFFDVIMSNNAEELFIVGDLFDSWIEYRQVVPKGFYRVFSKIYELKEKGIKITYLAGNHDFWRGKYFTEEFGYEITDRPIDRDINGKKFFIHHGDGLAYNDTGYKILKVILRSRISQFLYSWIHPDIGVWLARKTSSRSRDYTSQKDYSKKDGLKDYAEIKAGEGYNFIVMGHRHKPVMEKFGKGSYINLGDWFKSFSYGIYQDGNFSLKKFYDFKSRNFVDELIAVSE
jgi:UDP-2,3-diacylglucosamine hydrolase